MLTCRYNTYTYYELLYIYRQNSNSKTENINEATSFEDPLWVTLQDTATANDIILSTSTTITTTITDSCGKGVTTNGGSSSGLQHKYFIYSLPFSSSVVELSYIIGLLSAPFSRKAKLTVFDNKAKVFVIWYCVVKYAYRVGYISDVWCSVTDCYECLVYLVYHSRSHHHYYCYHYYHYYHRLNIVCGFYLWWNCTAQTE